MISTTNKNRIVVVPVVSFTDKLPKKQRTFKETLAISKDKGFKAYQAVHVYTNDVPKTYIDMCELGEEGVFVLRTQSVEQVTAPTFKVQQMY